jgi:hypothetical protein
MSRNAWRFIENKAVPLRSRPIVGRDRSFWASGDPIFRDNGCVLFRRRVKQLTIANPCRENWHAMEGGDTQRFCGACNRSVHDLSALTSRQAAELFANNSGKLCGRISYDERGNQIFAREHSPIERLMQISVLGASAMATAAAAPSCEVKVRVVDPAGYVIPKAIVKLSNTAGAEAVSSGKSNEQGEFSSRIVPGVYSLQIESPGFFSFRRELTCKTSETVSVEAPLRIGDMGEIVLVTPKPFPIFGKLRALFHRP